MLRANILTRPQYFTRRDAKLFTAGSEIGSPALKQYNVKLNLHSIINLDLIKIYKFVISGYLQNKVYLDTNLSHLTFYMSYSYLCYTRKNLFRPFLSLTDEVFLTSDSMLKRKLYPQEKQLIVSKYIHLYYQRHVQI